MATVQTLDFDKMFEEMTAGIETEQRRRLHPPLVELYDGDWNFRGVCKQEYNASFQWVDNETGIGKMDMPIDYYLSEWLVDIDARPTTNVHVRVEKDGARWTGRMEELQVNKDDNGEKYVRVIFKSDYEELKNILAWANPFLPAEVQFPHQWLMFGSAKFSCLTTLFCNILRLEASLWMLPDNPLDLSKWFNLDQSTWSMAVKPMMGPDNSVGGVILSRFKNMHEATRKAVTDGQLSWEWRRYFEGDEPPWPGANLRNGCLVWDLVDKSGFTTGTAFRGNIFGGIINELVNIGGDGLTETIEQIDDPNIPGEYYQPGYRGTKPEMPGVIFPEGERTGISSSSFSHKPAGAVQSVAGGHSMPGTNEALKALVTMTGDLTAMIPGVPPLGGVADALLAPLYTDTFLAFGVWKSVARAQRSGWSHKKEKWAEGADRAYTIGYVLAQRASMYESREVNRCTLTVEDNSPWRVGAQGFGDFFLGDRVGFTILGMPAGRIFVERVAELTLAWSRDDACTWTIQIGERQHEDPMLRAFQDLQEFFAMLQQLGVL
ncbi:phage tail protein [Rhodococcus sp. 05-2254-5]|uniref:Gp37-like protein n=1 Tax=unclassified Rhodococcus (in: high G+C Gram-positive bacteria) TaxID=192944 RepID=UPI000B9AFDAB|nr:MULTISPECIES: phage tail protein [unclassified Rhodococcus (in: high G+C Gram-positive bacteria)]OZE39106.1 phage tail protein [Rhodococcus sp. 05-2254-5]OZE59047.1 phage tail protein [Rhodococcus sp. 05-2254-1]